MNRTITIRILIPALMGALAVLGTFGAASAGTTEQGRAIQEYTQARACLFSLGPASLPHVVDLAEEIDGFEGSAIVVNQSVTTAAAPYYTPQNWRGLDGLFQVRKKCGDLAAKLWAAGRAITPIGQTPIIP